MRRFLILASTLLVSWAIANEVPTNDQSNVATPNAKKNSQSVSTVHGQNLYPTSEWTVPTRTQGLVYATPEPPGSKGFYADFEMGQVLGTKSGDQNFTEFLIEGKYRFNRRNEVGFGQEAKKLYQPLTSEENSFLLNDTVLYYTGLLSDNLLSFQWKANVSVTVPVSAYSRNVSRMTRSMAGLEISRFFFWGRLSFRYQPAFSYYFNRYLTDQNGNPLRQMAIAQMIDSKFDLVPQFLSLNVWGQGFVYFFETYSNSLVSPAPSTELQFGTYLGVDIATFAQLQVGYIRGNTVIPDFHYEDDISTSPTSRLYAALKMSF
jgi:hypothetical protein